MLTYTQKSNIFKRIERGLVDKDENANSFEIRLR